MPKKIKKSEREIQSEIDLKVAELQKVFNEKRMYEAEKNVLEKDGGLFYQLAYAYKFEGLSGKYLLRVMKFAIDESRLSDEDKDRLREEAAFAIIWTGSSGIKSEDWPAVEDAKNAIVRKLREPI